MKIEAKFERFTENGANFVWYRGGLKHRMWLPLSIVKPTQNTEPFTFYVNTMKEDSGEIDVLRKRNEEMTQTIMELNRRLNERERVINEAFSSLSRAR